MKLNPLEAPEWERIIASLRLASSPTTPPPRFRAWMKKHAHSHNYDEAVVSLKGEHFLGMGDLAVPLEPGAVLFVPRNVSHDNWYGPSHAPCVDFWIHFLSSGRANMNFIIHNPGVNLRSLPVSPTGELKQDLARLSVLVENGAARPDHCAPMRFYLLFFLATLFRRLMQGPPPLTPPPESAVVESIKRYVASNLTEPLSLHDLAKAAGYSPFHFHRMFVRAEGATPREFIENRRLEHAISLLEKGCSITSAALDSGFSSSSRFSHIFRKKHHLSPKQWLACRSNG